MVVKIVLVGKAVTALVAAAAAIKVAVIVTTQ